MDQNISTLIGENAGKIWRQLFVDGPLEEPILLEKSGLKQDELDCAIGWLARENKIARHDATLNLSETNLTSKVGSDAGKIFQVLDAWGEISLPSIMRLTQLNRREVITAIGWLAREGKIESTVIERNGEQRIRFWLKE
ncbi:MAG: winged helix-turn-helix domain-containing protein [Candidatus Thermoplasmatota archaeon]